MENISRLILIILLVLLLAGVVYAEAQHIVLQAADSVVVTCAGQHATVVQRASDMVTVSCRPAQILPDYYRLYLPAVANGD